MSHTCKFCHINFEGRSSAVFCTRSCATKSSKVWLKIKYTDERNKKISKALLGKKLSAERRLNMSKAQKGRVITPEHREKLRVALLGAKSHFWKGGITSYERKLYLNSRRHARKQGAAGSHTQAQWEQLKASYNFTCPGCLLSEPQIKLTLDHIVPLSKGGSDDIENIQPLCISCNCKKHTKIVKYEYQIA